MRSQICLGLSGLVLCAAAAAGEVGLPRQVKFSSGPSAAKNGGEVNIAFAVAAPTDVEVAVLDAAGKIVRHLAAGALGGATPPPAPLGPGLAQELVWDGRDDSGRPLPSVAAGGGGVRVRVRLGLGVKLDGFVGEDPGYMPTFGGLATDPKGNLYVLWSSRSLPNCSNLTVFDRTGKRLRALMPMPADLPAGKAAGFNVIQTGNGHLTPRNFEGAWPDLYPGGGLGMALRVAADGTVAGFSGQSLVRLGPDGGTVGGWFQRPAWPQPIHQGVYKYAMHRPGSVAVAPDGQTVYVTGIWQTKPFGPLKDIAYPPNRIYRAELEQGKLEKFADVEGASGGLTNADFDRDGNLVVGDAAGKRIVVLSPEGKQLEPVPVPVSPRLVACHRRSGDLYILSGGAERRGGAAVLVKVSGRGAAAKEVCRLDLPRVGASYMALDDSAEPPVVWLACSRSYTGNMWQIGGVSRILRLEDRGTTFAETEHNVGGSTNHAAPVTRLAVHPETDMVVSRAEFTHSAVYEGLGGKRVKAPFEHCLDMGVGLDGNWYIQTGYGWDGPLQKFDRDLKPLPPNPVIKRVFGRWGQGFGSEGVACDSKGKLYVREQLCEHTVCPRGVVVYGPDGKALPENRYLPDHPHLKNHSLFPGALFAPTGSGGGVAVDWQGNLYIGFRGFPDGHRPPAGFENDPGYRHCSGCVVKVAPEGGTTVDLGGAGSRPPRAAKKPPEAAKGIKLTVGPAAYPCGPYFITNALKAYPGLGGMAAPFGGGCTCRQPMFQLDGWGRLWMPDAFTYSVTVVDNEGNGILQFGHYGNEDSRGGLEGGLVKTPEVPLGWPEAVGVSEKAVYVADVLNRRIVRLLKTFAAEELCPVK